LLHAWVGMAVTLRCMADARRPGLLPHWAARPPSRLHLATQATGHHRHGMTAELDQHSGNNRRQHHAAHPKRAEHTEDLHGLIGKEVEGVHPQLILPHHFIGPISIINGKLMDDGIGDAPGGQPDEKPAMIPTALPISGVGMNSARNGSNPTAMAVSAAFRIGSHSLADFMAPEALNRNW